MKRSSRALVEILRARDLPDPAVAHHRHPLAERHRLRLVVRHVDGRDAEALVELRQGGAHADAELRVEVRERLVEQEGLRLPHDRAAHRDPLALAAGQLRRPAVEQILEPEQRRDVGDPAGDLRLLDPARLQAVADVLPDAQMRVERVGLEDHRHVALAGRQVGHVAAADPDLAFGGLLEPRDHPQERRLAAARRPDEHEELTVCDPQRDLFDGAHASVRLADSVELDLGHGAMV